ncbi:MAG: hypothetical protein ABF238_00535 [Flavobacteriales bacterium]
MPFKLYSLCFVFLAGSFNSFSQYDPDYADEDKEDLAGLPFKERLYTGGNFWANFGTFTNLEISPLLGYRITSDYSVGVGLKYNYFSDRRFSPALTSSIYGGSVFTRYRFLDKLVAHAEFEMLNVSDFSSITSSGRIWVPIGLVGGGYASNGFQILALYDLIDDRNNPYLGTFGADSRIYLRIGFLFNL